MHMKSERSFLERPLSRRAATLAFSGLMLPVVVFFIVAVSVWEADASARSRAREEAKDQARVEAGFPAVGSREGAVLEAETARRIVTTHFAGESGRLTSESDSEIVAMTVDEVTDFRAETVDAGELSGILSVATASLLDDDPVRSEQRTFVASIRGSRVVEVHFGE